MVTPSTDNARGRLPGRDLPPDAPDASSDIARADLKTAPDLAVDSRLRLDLASSARRLSGPLFSEF